MDPRPWPVMQENGQLTYGPPADWQGPAPPQGCEVYVSRLPRYHFHDDFCPFFSRVGLVYEFRLMMDLSGSNRGYAFVKYSSQHEARRAIAELNGAHIVPNSTPIVVEESLDNCKLYISPLPGAIDNVQAKDTLSRHLEGVTKALVLPSKCSIGQYYCFVDFENHRMAAKARRSLQLSGGIPEWNFDVKVEWAVPLGQSVQYRQKNYCLYIWPLLHNESAEDITWILNAITVNMVSVVDVGKIENVGVVKLTSRALAEYIIRKLDGCAVFCGETLYVTYFLPHRMLPQRSEDNSIRAESRPNVTPALPQLVWNSDEDGQNGPAQEPMVAKSSNPNDGHRTRKSELRPSSPLDRIAVRSGQPISENPAGNQSFDPTTLSSHSLVRNCHRSTADYVLFSDFIGEIIESNPHIIFEILENILQGRDWGQLHPTIERHSVLPEFFSASLMVRYPSGMEVKIRDASTNWCRSPREAANDAAMAFMQEHILLRT